MAGNKAKVIAFIVVILIIVGYLFKDELVRLVKGEDAVVVYTSVDQEYAEPILQRFQQQTGIKVKAVYDVEASKTTGLTYRLLAEKKNPQADVYWNSEVMQTIFLRHEGVLATYNSPQRENISVRNKDERGYWAGNGGRARIIIVNKSLLNGKAAPTSINDFISGQWAGEKLAVAYPMFGTTATWAAALYACWGDEKAAAYFNKLAANNVQIVDGNSVVRDMVNDGQAVFGMTDSDDAAVAIAKNDQIEIVLPDQDGVGTLIIPCTVAMINGGPHPNNGKKLVDYLLSNEVEQQLIDIGFCQYPTHKRLAVKQFPQSFDEIYNKFAIVKEQMPKIFLR